jgi:hypothetical protein
MGQYHILNGDFLANQLAKTNLNQNFIVFRECLLVGDVTSKKINDFWKIRAQYIFDTFKVSNQEYFIKTVQEFEKINNISDDSEIYLWFENDLFCQVNMWFIISILSNRSSIKIYRIFPVLNYAESLWAGFANSNIEKLEEAFLAKVEFTLDDITLGNKLWNAYQMNDFNMLEYLSQTKSNCFESLPEVCKAQIERFPKDNSLGRPDRVLKEIIETTSKDFETVFHEFSLREGVYGFGDLQVRSIYDRLVNVGF